MRFKIPKEFMGVTAEEAIRFFESKVKPSKKNKPKVKPNQQPVPSNISNPENYLILEGRTHGSYSYPDLLVPMEKTYLGKNWNQAHDELRSHNEIMLTIRQFADFLSLLKSGKAYDGRGKPVDCQKLTSILQEITKVRDPWRSEWLDAKFGDGTITYHIIEKSRLEEFTEPMIDYKSEDGQISLADWLTNANYRGLPRQNVKSGKLYYYAPVKGCVARFGAGSDGADLGCDRNPTVTNSSLGVRAARKKI